MRSILVRYPMFARFGIPYHMRRLAGNMSIGTRKHQWCMLFFLTPTQMMEVPLDMG